MQVDFYLGKTLVGTELTSPYTGSWSTSTAGTYVVTAIARDNVGAWTTSAPVSISVAAAPVAQIDVAEQASSRSYKGRHASGRYTCGSEGWAVRSLGDHSCADGG